MQTFKRISSILLLMGLVLNALSACVSKEETRSSADGATFRVQKVTVESYLYERADAGLPNKRKFKFTACISDVAQSKTVPVHNFEVQMAGGRSEMHTTDNDGCLYWSEDVRFSMGRQPVWVTIERQIVAKGVHKGGVLIPLGLNPWLDGESKLPVGVDLRFEKNLIPADQLLSVAESNKALTFMSEGRSPFADRPQFWISSLKLNLESDGFKSADPLKEESLAVAQDRQSGAWVSVSVEFVPEVFVKSVAGDLTPTPLRRGRVALKPYIVAIIPNTNPSLAGERVILSDDFAAEEESIEGGLVRHRFRLRLPYLPTTGNIEFGLRVKYLDVAAADAGDADVLNFEGLFTVGSMNVLLGAKTLNPTAETNGDLQRVMQNRKDVKSLDVQMKVLDRLEQARSTQTKRGLRKASYALSRPKPNFILANEDGCETSIQRNVGYQVESCVYDPASLKGVPSTDFKVYQIQEDGSLKLVDERKSWQDGCFIWRNSQKHNFYDRQQYIRNTFVIENKELNFREKISLKLNPWDYGFTFGTDDSQRSLQDAEEKDRPAPELMLSNFNVNFREQTYLIDDLLNMDVQRRYTYQFTPRVLRHDSISGGVGDRSDLRDGVYIVRFILARHRQETEEGKKDMVLHTEEAKTLAAREAQEYRMVNPVRPKELPHYISHSEFPVLVRDGKITADVDFTMRELYLFGSRNSVIVQVVPADSKGLVFEPNSGCRIDVNKSTFKPYVGGDLKVTTYEAPQVLLEPTATGIFSPVAYSAEEILSEAQTSVLAKQAKEFQQGPDMTKEATLENFAKREGLRLIHMDNEIEWLRFSGNLRMQIAEINKLQQFNPGGYRDPKWLYEMDQSYYESIKDPKERVQKSTEDYAEFMEKMTNWYDKLHGFYFRDMSDEDFKTIVRVGVHPQNSQAPQVYQFAHLMCGWWVDQFYDSYLSQQQIDSMGKWIENKNELRSVEEWLRVDKTIYSQKLKPKFPFKKHFYKTESGSRIKGVLKDIFTERMEPDFYRFCLNDPYEFFSFEKKIVTEKVSRRENTLNYLGGSAQNYTVNEAFRVDQNYGWDSAVNYGVSMGLSFSTMDSMFGLTRFLSFMSFGGIRLSTDWSSNRSQKMGRYRGQSLNFQKGPGLVVTRADMDLELEQYRHCLVIRPKAKAFNRVAGQWLDELKGSTADQLPYRRAGILLCSDSQKAEANGQPLRIQEAYYYVMQLFAAGAYQQDAANIANRPFLLSLRGADEFDKFLDLTRGLVEPYSEGLKGMPASLMDNHIDPLVGVIKAFQVTKATDRTGFYPGVYTVVEPPSPDTIKPRAADGFMRVFEFLGDHHPLGFIGFDDDKF